MQKNLGYVIPNIVIPDAATGIGYWYLGSTPLGFRATGTVWTIGEDHYWYCDNIKTEYLAEIPVEFYNAIFDSMIEDYSNEWNNYFTDSQKAWSDYFTARQNEWTEYFTGKQVEFNDWFEGIKGTLGQDVAGNLQNEIDGLFLETISFVNKNTTIAEDGTITEVLADGRYIKSVIDTNGNMLRKLYSKHNVLLYTHKITFNADGSVTEELINN